jgi:hypothetical protein
MITEVHQRSYSDQCHDPQHYFFGYAGRARLLVSTGVDQFSNASCFEMNQRIAES